MPVLRNAKHEAFAQAVARGRSQEEAYTDAGFKPHRQNASRLMTNDDVRIRLDEIKNRIAEKAEWSSADRLLMLKQIAAASKGKDPRVAVSAIAEANKMQGSHAAVRHQIGGVQDSPIEFVHKIERSIVRPADPDS